MTKRTQAHRTSSAPSSPREPRDWLGEIGERAKLSEEARASLLTWLAEQFTADEFAKLGQGGHAETRVPLRQVFIDLPVSEQQLADTDTTSQRDGFLATLSQTKPRCLRDPSAPSASLEEPSVPSGRARKRSPSGYLVLGGPGQGKSTLCQLACQVHRAALLEYYAPTLPAEVETVLAPFRGASDPGISLPDAPLFPLRIVLPEAASWMAQAADTEGGQEAPRLLRFVAAQPSATQAKLDADTLRAVLGTTQSMIVFDGFDEVGATVDRDRTVAAIRELLQELAENKTEVVVVATTRPQGYSGELSRIGAHLATRRLAQLRTPEALDYGRRLVEAKIQGKDERASALKQLREAAAEPSTQRLLRTPLQVTIMAALVQQQGRVPSERWQLFSKYFAFTYNREIERGTYASSLLQRHRTHVEEIHRRIGLLLQAEGEVAGGAIARVSRERLKEIADVVLQEDEIDLETRGDLVTRMVDAAENRLVFLVEPEAGNFGFEIRSLQEFMAAWALTEGADAAVEARMGQIAKAASFRNVVLFAASRFFSERATRRDMFAGRICPELDSDNSDAIARLYRAGGHLALEILEEGSADVQPKRARDLMLRAATLLDLPPAAEHARLARVATPDTEIVLQSRVEAQLAKRGDEALSGWTCLVEATNQGAGWAIEIGNASWDKFTAPGDVLRACRAGDVRIGQWIVSKIEASVDRLHPADIIDLDVDEHALAQNSWVRAIADGDGYAIDPRTNVVHIGRSKIPRAWAALAALSPAPSPFRTWIARAQFEREPSARTLAGVLRAQVSAGNAFDQLRQMLNTCWPLAACLAMASSDADLARFADALDQGLLGDVSEWKAAELEWLRQSPSIEIVFDESASTALPWTPSIINKAPPFCIPAVTWSLLPYLHRLKDRDMSHLKKLSSLLLRMPDSAARSELAAQCLFMTHRSPAPTDVSSLNVREWVFAALRPHARVLFALPARAWMSEEEWLGIVDEVGSRRDVTTYCSESLDAYLAHPEKESLLRLASMYAGTMSRDPAARGEATGARIRRLGEVATSQVYQNTAACADAALLRISVGAISRFDVKNIVSIVLSQIDREPQLIHAFFNALHSDYLQNQIREEVLLTMNESLRATSSPYVPHVYALLSTCLRARRSDLGVPAIWNQLQLPVPHPAVPAVPERSFALPDAPIVLQSIRVRHLRILTHLYLELAPPPAGAGGQWVFLLGPNGSGKTTLLRSLALSLRNLAIRTIWPAGAFTSRYLSNQGAVEATVSVAVQGAGTYLTSIRGDVGETFFQEPPLELPRPFPIFAYGCRRSSSVKNASLKDDDGGPEIATLFDDSAGLVNPEQWLVEWEGEAAKTDRGKIVFAAACGALQKLLEVDRIEVRDRTVHVSGSRVGGTVPFHSLSDGYLTSAGWFVDVVARWIELAVRHGATLDEHFMASMTGLVLIDEIDLHLHPAWQIEIVSRVRTMLPRMSFVVTTHNPLTLVGARPEEIWVLAVEDGEVRPIRGTDAPMLLTGGQIYSRSFGIQSLYPHELGRKLRRYAFLSGYPARDDAEQEEMIALREGLTAAGIDTGWDESPRELLTSPKQVVRRAKQTKKRGKTR